MIEVYIDGASAGDPGLSGAGVFIKGNGYLLRHAFPLPSMSNHEAEFHACLKGLEVCKEHDFPIISIRSDSKVVVDAIEKRYVKNILYRGLLADILKQMENEFDYAFIKWIPSKSNKEADQLARQGVRQSLSKNTN
ncbi:reverse transcriptase-like protein [Salipaludibacillus agaradhaerens]|uniref:reverse transcriptase-like protein n=1 Tax=Salipaludibacillus agaradhaerens TaxID=76935 RepID=UPI002151E1C7|nr:reverse transcriptase-like protein [Salipaludibacillus agaradhaerens]MCR6118885.1 reverse transcriptase-like protein [Salipaludibacillus agaradhaerens]UJW57959.1 reverse transcriptase-like protein [Bacillus sp. A116_S68]